MKPVWQAGLEVGRVYYHPSLHTDIRRLITSYKQLVSYRNFHIITSVHRMRLFCFVFLQGPLLFLTRAARVSA